MFNSAILFAVATLREVTVTASSVGEKLQNVSSSITALTESQLKQQNIAQFDDFVSQIPNISFTDSTRVSQSNFFKDDNYQIVDMDIKGREYAVSFLSSSNLSHVDNIILTESFLGDYQNLLTKLQSGNLMLTLPKFELAGKKQLKSLLITLGMSDAFGEGSADFSRMGTAGGNIFLTRVIHDTYIKVDEKGIEGAAVTSVGVGTTSVPPSMDFNKPFVFVLRHKESGVPIFIGKVENPKK